MDKVLQNQLCAIESDKLYMQSNYLKWSRRFGTLNDVIFEQIDILRKISPALANKIDIDRNLFFITQNPQYILWTDVLALYYKTPFFEPVIKEINTLYKDLDYSRENYKFIVLNPDTIRLLQKEIPFLISEDQINKYDLLNQDSHFYLIPSFNCYSYHYFTKQKDKVHPEQVKTVSRILNRYNLRKSFDNKDIVFLIEEVFFANPPVISLELNQTSKYVIEEGSFKERNPYSGSMCQALISLDNLVGQNTSHPYFELLNLIKEDFKLSEKTVISSIKQHNTPIWLIKYLQEINEEKRNELSSLLNNKANHGSN